MTGGAPAARRYLITGGTSGIGRAVARHLTAAGHRVWITGTRPDTVAAALAEGAGVGGSACDIADPAAVAAAFTDATRVLGGLDGVFVNAGIDGQGVPAEKLDPAQVRRLFDVNVVGVLTCAQQAHAVLERPGVIVVNASVNALKPELHFADYNASKAAALSVAKSLALEWSAEGLAVIAVCPGYFPSRMTQPFLSDPEVAPGLLAQIPAGRFGRDDDIGALLEFLLGPDSQYLTGAAIPIDGGRNV
jgi:NAD(P)-dependent dehydrogenase (short-subunit alcohol dehydrogenase family)